MLIKLVLSVMLSLFVASQSNAGENDTLVFKITAIKSPVGNMQVAVYKNDSNFFKSHPFRACEVPLDTENVHGGVFYTTFHLPSGDYAVAFHHDVNGDRRMNKNFIGFPTEPFTFSRPFVFLLGPPKFKDIAYHVSRSRDTLTVRMQNQRK
jgi:uncharacterized protein (DUF2141 family)